METGTIRNRSGGRYKPSVITVYRWAFDSHILPALGPTRLGRLNRADVQLLIDQLAGEELAANTIRSTVTPLQALYAWAIPRGLAHVSPCDHLRLPSGETARDRVATPTEAATLIRALPAKDQAALGLAVYAGLRIGELLAIEWPSIDLDAGSLRVTRAWDPKARRFLDAKTKAGHRVVPVGERLATLLADHRVLMNHPTAGLVFPGRDASRPVSPGGLRSRADKAWSDAGLEPLGFHEARHTFASLMIAAGVNAKALSTYMGHANISITFDRYGHLMPGNEAEARGLFDAYLEREGG
jgi:integrase